MTDFEILGLHEVVLRHFCMADVDRLYPKGTVFEDCPICTTLLPGEERIAQEFAKRNARSNGCGRR